MKIAYLLDTGSSFEIQNKKDCFFVPMIIDVKEANGFVSFKDFIDLNNEQLTQFLLDKKEIKTSQPIIGMMTDKITEILKEYDKVIAIPLSSELSSTCNTFISLQKQFGLDKLLVANANAISITGNWLVDDINEYLQTHEDIDQIELNNLIKDIKKNQCGSLIISDPTYLIAGGRISGLKGLILRTLKLKLVIKFQGDLKFADKSINFFDAIDKALDVIDKNNKFRKYGIKRYTIMAGLTDEKENLKYIEYIQSILSNEDKYTRSLLPGCVQCHTGANNFSILIEANKTNL